MDYFKGKNVLITGGASGIGKIMGRMALEKGANLLIWDIDTINLEQTGKDLTALGKVSTYEVDLSSPEKIAETAQKVKDENGGVDILINNAGVVTGNYFHKHSTGDIVKTMEINALAPMLVAAEFLPGMIQRKTGHICNIASSAGLAPNPKMSVYASSKWAVVGWSDSLRLEMKELKSKVAVTTVTPYYINTGMFKGVRSVIPIQEPEKAAAKIIKGIEKKKIYVSMPWSVHFVRLSQGIFPTRFYDWFVGGVLGIYKTMDHFEGREKKSLKKQKK